MITSISYLPLDRLWFRHHTVHYTYSTFTHRSAILIEGGFVPVRYSRCVVRFRSVTVNRPECIRTIVQSAFLPNALLCWQYQPGRLRRKVKRSHPNRPHVPTVSQLSSYNNVAFKMLKSILITGGGSGIGAALAAELAERNCNVIVTGRRQGVLDAVARKSPRIVSLAADVTKRDDQTVLADAIVKLPEPRAIVHGAGYFQLGQLNALSADDWQRSFETNVTARWALSCQCAPHLEGGRVLFIGSDAGLNPRAGAAAYSVAQSASETLRRALQAEWADRGIAVAGFKPGLVDTDLVRGFLAKSETEFPSRAAYQAYLDRGEISMPETVAAFAAWLLLDVEAVRFSTTEWDIRHTEHHPEWLDRPLYAGSP